MKDQQEPVPFSPPPSVKESLQQLIRKVKERELPAGNANDPAINAQLAEEARAVRAALAGLPGEQRQVIELAYFGGFTQQEISQKLGQPLGTVKTRIRLGMQKLRAALTAEMRPE